jgi:hypothetical protein
MIDMASVYAERYKTQPHMLQAAVMGQSPDPKLDPYTALNALKLVKESQRMAMAGQAQQPTSSPSIVAEALAPAPSAQGLGAMVPGAMGGQGMPQGMPPQQRAMPQQPMQAASGGLASMPTPEEDYCGGGMVSFAVPTNANNNSLVQDPEAPAVTAAPNFNPPETDTDEVDTDEVDTDAGAGLGNAGLQSWAAKELQKTVNRIRALERREPTKAEKAEAFKGIVSQLENVGGPDIYGDVNRGLDERKTAMGKNYGQDQGLALIAAAGHVLKGRNLAEGASNAAPAFASLMSEANKAQQAESRAIESMKFNVNDAQRKERMGNRRAAMSAMETARKDDLDANKFALDKERAVATAYGTALRATRPGAAGAGGPKPLRVDQDAAAITKQIITLEAKNPEDPQIAVLKKQRAGLIEILGTGKDFGPAKAGSEEAKLASKTDTDLDARVAKDKIFDQAWQDAKTPEEKDAAETALRNRIIARRQAQAKTSGKPSDTGVNKNSTTAPDISTIKGAPAGSTIGKSTAKGWEVLDSSGKIIGYAK